MNEKNNLVKKLELIKQLLQLKKDYSNDQLSMFLFIENIIEKKHLINIHSLPRSKIS